MVKDAPSGARTSRRGRKGYGSRNPEWAASSRRKPPSFRAANRDDIDRVGRYLTTDMRGALPCFAIAKS
jgi:hypothetical protein